MSAAKIDDPTTADEPDEVEEVRTAPAAAGVRVTRGGTAAGSRWSDLAGRIPARWVVVVAVLAVVGGGLLTWRLTSDDLPKDVAFRIGETSVSVDDVDRRVDALHALYGVEVPEEADEADQFQRDAAKSMAVQIMLEEEADDRGIAVGEKEVTDALELLIEQRYPDQGRSAFVAALGDRGATEDQVRDEIGSQLLVSRLFDDVVGDIEVSDDDVRQAFAERRDDLATPERRVLRNIVVADRRTAVQVVQALRSGTAFGTAARELSIDEATRDEGGLVGTVAASQLESRYSQVAFEVRPGEIFGPVRTEHGWNVGRIDQILAPKPASFRQVRERLRETLVAEESLAEWRGWLGDVLEAHEVEYADGYRPDDPYSVPDVDQADVSSPGE